MIRLFVAIDLPPAICSLVHDIARDIPGARLLPRNQLHLTLKFIGTVEAVTLPSLAAALATVQTSAFSLAMKGVGHFPTRGRPRIVWVGITPRPELEQIHARIDQDLEKLGIAREIRQFSPHVTIARLKNPDLESLRHFCSRYSTFQTEPFQIENFSLYKSKMTAAGAIHTIEAFYELGK